MEYGDKEQLYIIVSDEGFHNIKDDYLMALQEYGINILNFADKEQLELQLGGKKNKNIFMFNNSLDCNDIHFQKVKKYNFRQMLK